MKPIIEKTKRALRLFGGLLGLGLVIIVHEFGHFLACKLFNVGTPTFSIGFGPQLVGYHIGNTLFQIAVLPLGGYVEIAINDLEAQPYLVKIIIMLAGIIFNFVFAFAVFMYLSFRAKYKPIPVIEKIIPDSPAADAGLQVGDVLITLDQKPIGDDAATFMQTIIQSPGAPVTITIERNGTLFEIPITIANYHPIFAKGIGWLGASLKKVRIPSTSWRGTIRDGFIYMGSMMRKLGTVISMRTKKRDRGGITGPIGIITMTAQSLQFGIDFFLLVLAILSINIGFFNLLPIPFFDGGKVALYTIEALRGPLPTNIVNLIYLIFFILLMFIIFTISVKDIGRLRRRR